TDRAGNVTRALYTLNLKTTAPELSIVEDGSPIAQNALFNRTVTPVVRSTESSASVSATLNGTPFVSGTTLSADGAYSISATASDNAGHTATASATFSIDRTPPAVKIDSPAEGATINSD